MSGGSINAAGGVVLQSRRSGGGIVAPRGVPKETGFQAKSAGGIVAAGC